MYLIRKQHHDAVDSGPLYCYFEAGLRSPPTTITTTRLMVSAHLMDTRVEAYPANTLKTLLRLLNRNHALTKRPYLVWLTLAQHASELNYAMKENPQTTTHRYVEGDEATMIANSEVQGRKE
ncbi:hypothetical protein FDENT_5378 [Fusarium denticulatum]|uniref:Uncharacterized protein n=1 Tax=Fusarium denticulatum TaxID=48507 RepID=A0A8H5UDT9_9HYPO|nr:hypothetical protein FDENT_5378 [Fusarium denticulatum]